ncbi:MAG: acylneuraminate cytidylyltransferase family protein [Flammeovirgaceae bacterium]
MNILITICARGGSKGIIDKNIKNISGKPLIEYTIQIAKKITSDYKAKLALSTDDSKIKQIADKLGLFSNYKRPDYLATDSAGKIETIKDLLLYEESLVDFKYDFVLDLDVTSPLRTLADIKNGLEILKLNKSALNLFSVNAASRNPYFNMVEENSNGFVSIVKSPPNENILTRQSAPKVYDLNASFYWYRRSFFDLNQKSTITDKSLIYKMNHICFDLDYTVDFLFLEYLIENNKLDFDL